MIPGLFQSFFRAQQPLWSLEEITSHIHSIRSAEQLEHFLKYVLRIFKESMPSAHIEQRWGQEALHLALNCSSRHYAGRSFQVKVLSNMKLLFTKI